MEAATPFDTAQSADVGTTHPRGECRVADDRRIYEELIAPLRGTMMRSIWRVVRNADLAEDCLQEALAVIWTKRHRIRSHPNPPAFVLKICLDAAYDALRRVERMRRQADAVEIEDRHACASPDAVRDIEGRELAAKVQQAIRRLPRKRAIAVLMRCVHEESFATIAAVLGCKEGTVRIHVSKGRAQLKEWLAPVYGHYRQEGDDE